MLHFLSDENFHGHVVHGLLLRRASMDLVRIQDLPLAGAEDPEILEWAAANGRIVLTHDMATMPDFAYDRIAAGLPMPGLFAVSNRMPIAEAIDELLIVDECSNPEDWEGVVQYFPL